MKREELLQKAALTDSKLRRFVSLGLIVSKRKGKGRAKGLSTDYHEKSLDTVMEITQLEGIKQEHLIFVLFWKGYPVALDKLKEALRTYLSAVIDDFDKVAKVTLDPDNAEFAVTKMVEDALPSSRPGRPSKAEKTERLKRAEIEEKLARALLGMIRDLAFQKSVSVATMKNFMDIHGVSVAATLDSSFSNEVNWPNLQQMTQAVLQSEEKDYFEILEIIGHLRHYWSLTMKALESTPSFAPFLELINRLNSAYPGGIVSENPALIRYIFLILLVFKDRTNLLEFLQSEALNEFFIQIEHQISGVQETNGRTLKGGGYFE